MTQYSTHYSEVGYSGPGVLDRALEVCWSTQQLTHYVSIDRCARL